MKNKQKPLTPQTKQKNFQTIQIHLQQPRHLFSLRPPEVSEQAFTPLVLEEKSQTIINSLQRIGSQFSNNESFQVHENKSQPFIPPSSLISENQNLKRELIELKNLYQEQKIKYIQLRDLYKEGEAMFSLLEDKKIFLERENRELKNYIESLSQQLLVLEEKNQKNECSKSRSSVQSKKGPKINKVTIGSKKIPVIKVNVPDTFLKKDPHAHSTSSLYSEQTHFDKAQVQHLQKQVNQLRERNLQLQVQNDRLKGSFDKNGFLEQNNNVQLAKKQHYGSQLTPKETGQSRSSSYSTSSYVGPSNMTPFKTLEQFEKKDKIIKRLQQQCSQLKSELFRLRTKHFNYTIQPQIQHSFTFAGKSEQNYFQKQSQHQNKQLFQLRLKMEEKDRQISTLQQKVENLTQYGKRLMADCNSAITQLQKQNQFLNEKNSKVQFQLTRLYKVLENKNIQLGEIYSAMKESRRDLSHQKRKPLEIHLSEEKRAKSKEKTVLSLLTSSNQYRPSFTEKARLFKKEK